MAYPVCAMCWYKEYVVDLREGVSALQKESVVAAAPRTAPCAPGLGSEALGSGPEVAGPGGAGPCPGAPGPGQRAPRPGLGVSRPGPGELPGWVRSSWTLVRAP